MRTALPPFRAAIEAGARAIMTAHLSVPALDAGPATLSRRVITGLLREQLAFGGLVVTDALEMRAISGTVGVRQAAVMAVAAGADALCLGRDLTGEEVTVELAGAGNGDSVDRSVTGGSHTVSQSGGSGGSYDTQLECRADGGTGDVVPAPGDSTTFRGLRLTAHSTDERRVRELLVETMEPSKRSMS